MKQKIFFIILIVVLISAISASADKNPYLFGIIYNQRGDIVKVENMEIFLIGSSEILRTTTSDGEYLFWNIPEKYYAIIVVAPGYNTQIIDDLKKIRLERKDINLSITLRQR